MGLSWPDGRPLTDAEVPMVRALRGEVVQAQEILVSAGRRNVHMLTHARPLRHENGHVIGAIASTYDISVLREREADLAAFAGVVAHDLNSPLAAIGGYCELVEEEVADALPGPAGEQAQAHLGRMRMTVERMGQLIEDLLTYTAAGDAKFNPTRVDLHAVVDEVVSAQREAVLATGGRQRMPDVYVGPLPAVLGDEAMIRQLVTKLVGNAIKYTPPGQAAHVDITAEPEEQGRIRVNVADRGIGIPQGQHHAIFGGFHRAHHDPRYAGTGLGLAICDRIVQRHGGTIGVTDRVGGGSRFYFTVDLAGPESSLAKEPPPLSRSTAPALAEFGEATTAPVHMPQRPPRRDAG
jgi:signal transduction histidine kinase